MGQRSQFVFRTITSNNPYARDNFTQVRTAMHLPWNYGLYMVMRAANALETARSVYQTHLPQNMNDQSVQVVRCAFAHDTLTGDVQGLSQYDDVSDESVSEFDNSDGVFLLDVDADLVTRFGFLIGRDLKKVVGVEEYLADYAEQVAHFKRHATVGESAMFRDALTLLREAEEEGFLLTQKQADSMRAAAPSKPYPLNTGKAA